MKINSGFSFIELIVVVVITSVLFAGGIAAYRSIGGRQQVKQAGISFQTNLRLFQERALAGDKPAECTTADKFLGYEASYVDSSSYTVTPICEGKITTPINFSLDDEVSFNAPWTDTIVFYNQQSEISGSGTINLSKTGQSYYYQVVIDPSGVISGEMVQN